MVSEAARYFAVYAISTLKFIAGPITGAASGLSFFESAICTTLGMMTSVLIFTNFAGTAIRNWVLRKFYKNRKLFSPKNRKMVRIWRKYGIKGVAFLTPILFSPILGTLLATSFGESRGKIIIHMLVSAIFWATVLSLIFTYFKEYTASQI